MDLKESIAIHVNGGLRRVTVGVTIADMLGELGLDPRKVAVERNLEIVPTVRRIGLLSDPTDPLSRFDHEALSRASADRGMAFIVAEASNPDQYDAAVRRLIGERVDVIYATSSISVNLAARVIEPATRKRVPVFGGRLSMVQEGALLSYGGSLAAALRRSAQLVDKLLKGAKPAEVAIEQPVKLELVVNQRAARVLGITVPAGVLLRADEVIQ